MSVCFVGSVRSAEVEYISECALDLRVSSTSPESLPPSPSAAIVRPIAVKLPLRAVSDRMNVQASVRLSSMAPLRRAGKTSDGAGARDVDRFPMSVNENMTETAEERWSADYNDDAQSNSDDEVCDVFSRGRHFQAATATSSWLQRDIDGRCCVKFLRAAAAVAAGARSNRCIGLPQRWLHDNRTSTVMNAVELPRPFLDFTKMQVLLAQFSFACQSQNVEK